MVQIKLSEITPPLNFKISLLKKITTPKVSVTTSRSPNSRDNNLWYFREAITNCRESPKNPVLLKKKDQAEPLEKATNKSLHFLLNKIYLHSCRDKFVFFLTNTKFNNKITMDASAMNVQKIPIIHFNFTSIKDLLYDSLKIHQNADNEYAYILFIRQYIHCYLNIIMFLHYIIWNEYQHATLTPLEDKAGLHVATWV